MRLPDLDHVRFRTQTTVLLGTIVVTLVAVLSAVCGALIAETTRTQVGSALHVVANDAQRMLADGLHQRLLVVEGIASTPGIWNRGLDGPEVGAAIDLLQRTGTDLAWIGVADTGGIVRTSTGGLLLGRDVGSRPWFAAGRAGPHVGDVHEAVMLAKLLPKDRLGEPQRFVDFAVPIVVDGEVRGVIGLHGGWEWTRRVIETLLPDTAEAQQLEVFILNRAGATIYARPGTKPDALKVGDVVGEITSSAEGTSTVRWPDGRDYLTAIVRLEPKDPAADLGWQVVARIPSAVANAPVAAAVARVLLAGTVVASLAMCVAWFASKSISGPLATIALAAADVQAGREGACIPRIAGNLELRRLSSALIAMTDEFELRVRDRTRQLEEANVQLDRVARLDPLTQLLNRRGFEEQMKRAVAAAKRRGATISAIALDVDHFKKVNDTYGHSAGDGVLMTLGAILQDRFRESDIVARVGGEEFLVLLLDTDLARAGEVARALVARVAATVFPVVGHVTISCGVSMLISTRAELPMERADRALYRAKSAGRNRAVTYATEIDA